MRFNKVFVEISGFCGLECDFCPPKPRQKESISLEKFASISSQLSKLTRQVSLHLLGDPLTQPNLGDYLDILHKNSIKANITTSGHNINRFSELLSTHKAVKQVNFSLNSYNGLRSSMPLEKYLEPIFDFCDFIKETNDRFANLRLWNGGGNVADNIFFSHIQDAVLLKFGVKISNQKRERLASRVIFDFDDYFEWPSLDGKILPDSYCLGLGDHFGILSDGRVVPCCLDAHGSVELGNVYQGSLQDILSTQRTRNIADGFKNNTAIEELCKRCSYRLRFSLQQDS